MRRARRVRSRRARTHAPVTHARAGHARARLPLSPPFISLSLSLSSPPLSLSSLFLSLSLCLSASLLSASLPLCLSLVSLSPISLSLCLSNAIRLATGSPPSVYRLRSSSQAVSVYITSSLPVPIIWPTFIFSVQVAHSPLVPQSSAAPKHWSYKYLVQMICSTCLQDHNSNAVNCFSLHFFTAKLPDPYNAMLHTNDLTSYFLCNYIC